MYVAPSYAATSTDREHINCPYNIFSTGLGLFSRVTIPKGVDIGVYGGLVKSDVKFSGHKSHARRSGDSIHVYDGLPVREWLIPTTNRIAQHKHRASHDVEYIISPKAPPHIIECWNRGRGFMMNTSLEVNVINVSLVQEISKNSLLPSWIMRTITEILPGDELLSLYQSQKVNYKNQFIF